MLSIFVPLVAVALAAAPSRDAAVEALAALTKKFPALPEKTADRVRGPLAKGDAAAADDPVSAERHYRLAAIEAELIAGEAAAPPAAPPPAADLLAPPPQPFPYGAIVSAETLHTVARGETLPAIARRYGANADAVARKNGLTATTPLVEGKRLRVPTRRIAPRVLSEGIVVNIPERTLYYFRDGSLKIAAPVSLGKPKSAPGGGWETPTGQFRITGRAKDPVWNVPKSIRDKMALNGEPAAAQIPPGPANPLGKYALKTSIPRILIHGTNSPSSIFRFSSHGCIRVGGREMEALYRLVAIDTPGEILYEPVKVATTEEGRVYLEVHRDAYGKVGDLEADARRLLSSLNLQDAVDWRKVRKAVMKRAGTAEEVTHDPPQSPL